MAERKPPRAATTVLDGLNEAQRRAARFGIEAGARSAPDTPPLLVIAGAGSGKTLTLAARVACLVVAGANPARILLLTFSRRAALEMERRVGATLHDVLGLPRGSAPPRLAWCGTFHSVAARLLRLHAAAVGLDPAFTVDDRADSEDLLHLVRQRLGLADTARRFPQKATCLGIYSRTVNARRALGDVLDDAYPWCRDRHDDLERLFTAYADEKAKHHVLDFDDLLVWWAEAMAEPSIRAGVAARFDHVLVDEYQDTNRIQAEIVFALRPGGRGLTVVGDDAQSIYSFRAAEVRNILDFAASFSPRAEVVALEQNFRATPALLDASNAVIALAPERHAKTMWTERRGAEAPALVWVDDEAAEARWVAERVLALRETGLALRRQAVLFRSASHSHALELELARRDIPFVKYGGLRFLDSAHVKDVLAVLRFATNPRGQRAGLRALQLTAGIGAAGAERLLEAIAGADDPDGALAAHRAPRAAAAAWTEFIALYARLRCAGSAWPTELAEVERWYRPILERRHDDATTRAADVAHLVRLGRGYLSRERFLTELALDPPAAASDEAGPPGRDEDHLILSTIHSAKGQEWSAVSVLRVVDGCLPSDMATGNAAEIEEERRLLYVAMTRARQHLHLLVPKRFYVTQQHAAGDRHVWGAISRFVPDEIQRLFEHIVPTCCEGAVPQAAPAAERVDIGARVRRAWG